MFSRPRVLGFGGAGGALRLCEFGLRRGDRFGERCRIDCIALRGRKAAFDLG
jgi:hypothetical protein